DEVTQDVFMKIYKNLKKFNSLSSLNTWIYRITVNTAINRLKAEKKHTASRIDYDPAVQPVSQKEAVKNNIDSKEQISVLLNALNPDQRACVVLREIEGLNYKEIANALRININTVRTRLKRAREKLLAFAKKG
ncbi:MAG: RNA polymerase sigma factor, partial [Candidatus Omnitrophica bacterium]|nr:RNA polymerase sigma factor [Candidatus Omnitrophota bacterium]